MREIFKYKKGKDFYKNSLEYLEYDPSLFQKEKIVKDSKDDDEISFYIFYQKHQNNKK
jgi:hypothetical protein